MRVFDQKRKIDAQVATFNDTILNTFCSFVPNKYITIDDKDAVWMNETIKSKMKAKSILFKNIFRLEDLKVTSFFLKI